MMRLLYLLPVLLFAGIVAVFGLGLRGDPAKLPSVLIDKPLPAFELAGLDGPGFASQALTGEPRLLNVFGSWCAACQGEHPMLARIASEGTPVYGIDWKDTDPAARAWLAKLGNPYARIGVDPSARAGIDLGVTGAPETFVVDKRGRVRYKQIGPITPDDWEATLKPMLAKLKAEA